MTETDPEAIIARRRLRRWLGVWRLIAVLAVLAAIGAVVWRAAPIGPHVARYEVVGTIFADPERDELLRELAEDDDVRAVIVRIDSPGGTVAGSEALFAALRAIAEVKPLAAVMGEVAASGGYIAALAGDHLIARGGTITGSIGVVAEYPNVAELLDMIGVGVDRVASGPLKAEPSPLHKPSERALEAQEALIEDSHEWFLGLVAERRNLSAERARELGDGRVFTGRMAKEEGLIDAIGGEPEARRWLDEARGVSVALPSRDAEIEEGGPSIVDLFGGATAGSELIAEAAAALERIAGAPRLMAIFR